ncbi:hypothetical protein TTHERM_00647260 (macronuclear) [Tetrahymena thermophila SB210]|uniref:Uncharacterized protein n=1 Tax=Tetrahymena thermophila (strain SB210) TaxID=312017 RepID=I7MMY0_TETTS|nr:hypothetical protein TTHERM_00647260 [Tetrahymena thermophila SB210]EAS07193.2 hypothetical protein TTHERM_00647260 [Tetrahymena thermophila SB210]|eukprot:XP_001027435.2 hypothetical protein TTHERM_00647260 [Tetrahymena thermophila SB210]
MLNKATQQLPNMGDDQTPSEVTSIYSIHQSNCIQIQTPAAAIQPLMIPTQIPLDPIQRIKSKNSRSVTPDVIQVPTLVSSIEHIQNLKKSSNNIAINQINGGLIQKQPNTPNYNNSDNNQKQDIQKIGSLNQQFVVGINVSNNFKNNNQNSPRQASIGVTPIVHRRAVSNNSINSMENSQLRNITPIQSQNTYIPFLNSQLQLQNSNLNVSMNSQQQNTQQQVQNKAQLAPIQTIIQPPTFATALTLSGQLNERNYTPPSKISFSKLQSTGATDIYQNNEYRSTSLNQTRSQLLNIKISQYGKVMNAKDEKDIPQNPLKKITQKPLLNKTSSGYIDTQASTQLANISPIGNMVPPMLPIAPTSIKNIQLNRINNHQPQVYQNQQAQPQYFQIQSSQSVSPLRQNNKSFEREKTDSPEKLFTTIKPYISITNSAEFKPIQKVVINIPPNHPMNHQYQLSQQKQNQTQIEYPTILSQQNLQDQQAMQILQNNTSKSNSQQQQIPNNSFGLAFNYNSNIIASNYTSNTNQKPQIINSSPAAALATQQINFQQLNSTPQTLLTSTNQKVASLNSLNCFQSSNQLNDNAPAESKYNQSEQDDTNSSKIKAIVKPSFTTKKEQIEQLLYSNDSPLASNNNILQTPEKKINLQNINQQYEEKNNILANNVYQLNNTSITTQNINNVSAEIKNQTNLSPSKQEVVSSTSGYKNAQIQLRNTVDQLKNIIKQPQTQNNAQLNSSNTAQFNQLAEDSSIKANVSLDPVNQKKEIYQKRLLTINTQIEEIKKKNEDSTKNIGITINDLLRNEAIIEKQLSEYKEHQNQVGQKLLELDERIQKQVDKNNDQYLHEGNNFDQNTNFKNDSNNILDQKSIANQDRVIEEEQNQDDCDAIKKSSKDSKNRSQSPNKNEEITNQNMLLNSNSFGEPLNIKETNSFLEKSQPQLYFAQNKQSKEQTISNLFNSLSNGIHNLPETSSYVLTSDQVQNNLMASQSDQLKKKENSIVEQLMLGSRSQSQNEEQLLRQSTQQNANTINLNSILRKQNSSNSNSPAKSNNGTSPLRRLKNDLRKSISEMQGKKASSPLYKIKQNSIKNITENDISSSEVNQRSSLVLFKTDINSTSQLFSQASSENVDYLNHNLNNQNDNIISKNPQAMLSSQNSNQLFTIPESKQNNESNQKQSHQSNTLNFNNSLIQTKQSKTNSNQDKNNLVQKVVSSRESIIKQFQNLSNIQNKQSSPISKINTNTDQDKSISEDKSFNQDKSFTAEKLPKTNKNTQSTINEQPNISASSHLKRPNNTTYSNQQLQNKQFVQQKKQTTIKKDIKVETDLEKIKQVINKNQQKMNQNSQEKALISSKYSDNTSKNQNLKCEEQIQTIQKPFQTSAKSNTPKFSETKSFSLHIKQEMTSNQSQKGVNQMNLQDDSLIVPVNLNEQLQNQESSQKSSQKRGSQEIKQQQKQSNQIDYNGITFNGQQLLEKIQSHLGINIQNKSNNESLSKLADNKKDPQQQFKKVQSNQDEEIQYENEENQMQENYNENYNQEENLVDEYKAGSYFSQPQAQINYSNSYVQQDLVSQSVNHNVLAENQGVEGDQDEMNLIAALNDLNMRLLAKSSLSQSKLVQNSSQKYISKTPERAVTEANDDSQWQNSYSQNKTTQKQSKDKLNKSLSQEKSKNVSNSQSPMKGSYKKNQLHHQQLQQNLQQSMTELKKSNKMTQSPNQKMVQQELKRIFDEYSSNSKNENKKTLLEMQQLLYKSVKQQSQDNTQSPVKQPQYIQKKQNGNYHKKNNSVALKQTNYNEELQNKQQSQTEINTSNLMVDDNQPKAKKTYSGMHFKKQVYSIVKDVDDQNPQQNLQISQSQKKFSQELKESSNNNLDNLMKERSFEFWAEKIKNSDNPKQILDVWKMINSANKTKQ